VCHIDQMDDQIVGFTQETITFSGGPFPSDIISHKVYLKSF